MQMDVELSCGVVSVGELRWGTYKRLKARVLDVLGGDIIEMVSDMQGGDVLDAMRPHIAKIAAVFSEFNEEFVQGCVDSELPDDLSIADMRRLFDAAMKCNSIEEMVATEKNSPAAALVRALMPASPTETDQAEGTIDGGTSASSTDLYDPAGEYDHSID